MLSETDIMNLIRVELSKIGAVLFRNNVGLFSAMNGSKVRTGLCVGSSDLIGWYRGIFLAVEVKTRKGVRLKKQKQFIEKVLSDGGIAFFATSPEEAKRELLKYAKQYRLQRIEQSPETVL